MRPHPQPPAPFRGFPCPAAIRDASEGKGAPCGVKRETHRRWYAVRQDALTLSEGKAITHTVVEHPGFVVIVPLLPNGRVVMERIYRYPLQRVNLECPSGGLDGEEPDMAARRELEEETGYRAGRLKWLGKYAASSVWPLTPDFASAQHAKSDKIRY